MPVSARSDLKHRNETKVARRTDCELVLTRTFNGPARIVFDAWTKPELLKRWWAPCSLGVTLVECEADVRVGGTYRYAFGRDAEHLMVFSGTYLEVTPHTRLVYTQLFEPMREAGAALITATFEEIDGRTHFVAVERYPSKAALDGALAAGMEQGVRETMEQLEALIASHEAVSARASAQLGQVGGRGQAG
jgi:uncharacterized protein YndB with AHSA1/START domain